jgi:hypothetical protein
MDAGVIHNLKTHYRRRLIQNYLIAVESKKEFLFSLLDSLHWLKCAWNDVATKTIIDCFAHVGFKNSNEHAQLTESAAETPVIDNLWDRLKENGIPVSNTNFKEYVDIDQELLTCSQPTDDVIVEEVLQGKMVDESDQDASEDQESEVLPVPTLCEAKECLTKLRRYLETREEFSSSHEESVEGLDDLLINIGLKRSKQTTLFHFFQRLHK